MGGCPGLCGAQGQWETASLGRVPLTGEWRPGVGKEGQLRGGGRGREGRDRQHKLICGVACVGGGEKGKFVVCASGWV